MFICGIFVFRLQIVDTRSELVALTVLLGLGLKSLFIFLFIMFKVQPSLDLQLILTAGTLLTYTLWLWPQKIFSSNAFKFKQERFVHTKTFGIIGILFTLGTTYAFYFPITGADGIWYHVKGMVYFHEARFDSERIISQFRQYPPMIGLLYAWLISGNIERLPIIFPVLYFCLLIVVFHRLWDHSKNSKIAAFGTLVLGTTPYLWWHSFLPFLDLTATVFFTSGILYWFSLLKKNLMSPEGINISQNKSLAILSGLMFGFSSWTRPEFVLFSALPLFLLVCIFDRNEELTSERESIILRFGLASLTLPSLWFAVLISFDGPLYSGITELVMACVVLWLGFGLILSRVVRFPYKISRLVVITSTIFCLLGLVYVLSPDISLWNTLSIRIFRFFAVHIFFAGTIFLILFIFSENLEQLALEEKTLGVLLLLLLSAQFYLYAYSGLKWPTLSHYVENTFIHPGNSINLSDTRGALAIYPAFVFFIFCFHNLRKQIRSSRVRRFLFIIIGVNLVVIISIFAGPRVKYMAENLSKSYKERAENSGPSDMPNQFAKTYRVGHQLKKHVPNDQFLLLPAGNKEGSFRSAMTQILFPQKLIFANDSYLWEKFKKKESLPLMATERVGDNKLCNETEAEVLDKTGFVLCRTDKTRFNFLE